MTWFTATLEQAVRVCQKIAQQTNDYATIIAEVAAEFDVSEVELADAWAYVEDMEQTA